MLPKKNFRDNFLSSHENWFPAKKKIWNLIHSQIFIVAKYAHNFFLYFSSFFPMKLIYPSFVLSWKKIVNDLYIFNNKKPWIFFFCNLLKKIIYISYNYNQFGSHFATINFPAHLKLYIIILFKPRIEPVRLLFGVSWLSCRKFGVW